MKLKRDENIDARFALERRGAGHDALTVREQDRAAPVSFLQRSGAS